MKFVDVSGITKLIRRYLEAPSFGIVFWPFRSLALFVPMPKTPVNQDNFMVARKYYIR
jgi:hypothetical protein